MYITYYCLLRVLFASHSKIAHKFVKWASETLFIHQLGTTKQKYNLIARVKGVSYETIQELFSVNASSMPCIYLTYLGKVKDLREIMNIDSVYKFGLTKDMEDRKNGCCGVNRIN
jgi:hypothetical protein